MTDKVQKIREEVERLKEETSIGLSEHENGVEQGRMEIINALSLFLDSMQEEPASEDLEEVVEEIVDPTVLNAYGVKEIANRLRRTMIESISEEQVKELTKTQHVKETCKENGNSLTQEPISDDLEQAIDAYLATYFGGEKEKQEWPFLKKMAIHFANWQKKKDDYAIEIAHMAGEEEGKNIMKQQLMAKAVDATVHSDAGGYPYIPQMELYNYEKDIPFAKEGDKYKVILIKED